MSEITKTIGFICFGGLMLGLSALTYVWTQPAPKAGFEMVGKEFYEEFQSSRLARSLEVFALDAETTQLKQFRVEEEDGLWTIPSHYGYPAEASDRLATTASSLIGLTRQSLASRRKTDHKRLGVLDPLSDNLIDPESAGKRITLKDASGDVLVDLIIGRKAEKAGATESELAFGQSTSMPNYYVRRPDEDPTYKVELALELSTKFSDWIRPDLLDLENAKLQRISVDNYELVEQPDPRGFVQLMKKQGDRLDFTRDTGFGPWNMLGLNAEKQELDSAKIDAAAATLDAMRIVGVRKKTSYQGQQLLKADLTLNEIPELKDDIPLFRSIMTQLQQELSANGFNLSPVAQGSQDLMIVSNSGELSAGTEQGVVYTLQFGNPVEGKAEEIEIGASPATVASVPDGENDNDADDNDTNGDITTDSELADPASDESVEDEEIVNRYLMIRVSFDESLLGEKPTAPTEPVEPVQPEGYVPANSPVSDSDEDQAPAPGDDVEPGKTETLKDGRPSEFQEYDLAKTKYDQMKTEYELQLSQFQDSEETFAEKVTAGMRRVDELNERFGAWYYVISADNLKALQILEKDVVTEKTPENIIPEGGPRPGTRLPERPNILLNDLQQPLKPETDSSDAGSDSSDAGSDSSDAGSTDDVEADVAETPDTPENPTDGEAPTGNQPPANASNGGS